MTNTRKRIALVIGAITRGGAERVLSILSNYWAQQGREVHVLTLDAVVSSVCYTFHPSVVIHSVGYDNPSSSALRRPRRFPVTLRLRNAFRQLRPDAVVSFMHSTNIRVLLATMGTPTPVFACEHCDPRTRPIGPLNEMLRRWLYPLATSVVALSDEALSFFPSRVRARGSVIPNPVLPPPERLADDARVTGSPKRVISIGRLNPVKRFDRLISAFGEVAPLHPEWSLNIWGEGPERARLQEMINHSGSASRMRLCGTTDNVYRALGESHLFALTSETEGFPMALCEAMACGLPVVSMDCPSGPRQIIRSGIDGLLTPNADVPAFAMALARLMDDPIERGRLANRAPEVITRFGVDTVMKQWEKLLAHSNGAN